MHTLTLEHRNKAGRYAEILPQIQALITDEHDPVANLANTAAVLKQAFGWLWVGFYLVRDQELVLGPFQGPLACTRIAFGRGVCGQAWAQSQTLVVADVHQHPDHIACSSLSQSEIVVPIRNRQGVVQAVLDADADTLAAFDTTDAHYLEQLAAYLGEQLF